MELVEVEGGVISFLVGATEVEDLMLRVGAMLVGVEVTAVVQVIGIIWMVVDKGVGVEDLTTEEMFREVETEVTVVALIEFEHGISTEAAAEVEVEVGVGAGAGVAVEVAAGLVVAAIAVVVVHAAVAVVAVIAEAAAPRKLGVLSRNFLIQMMLCHLKQELPILKCSLYLLTPKGILLREQNMWNSYLLLGAQAQLTQRL